MTQGVLLAAGTFAALVVVGACRSEDAQKAAEAPSASAVESTKIVYSEALDAAPPSCSIHLASDSFAGDPATAAATVHVEGDYTHTLAKVSVERPSGPVWSGTFSGPRDAFFDMLRRHVCTEAHVYALKPTGNKDPSHGPVVMTAYEMKPDEKADVTALCHALSHADAGDPELRDRIGMQWVEDVLTTPTWDLWRRSFARARGELYARKQDASTLFHDRAADLEAASAARGITCPTAVEWRKR